jgi:hypothetical protein
MEKTEQCSLFYFKPNRFKKTRNSKKIKKKVLNKKLKKILVVIKFVTVLYINREYISSTN